MEKALGACGYSSWAFRDTKVKIQEKKDNIKKKYNTQKDKTHGMVTVPLYKDYLYEAWYSDSVKTPLDYQTIISETKRSEREG